MNGFSSLSTRTSHRVKFKCAAHLRNHLAMDVPDAGYCVGLNNYLKTNEIFIFEVKKDDRLHRWVSGFFTACKRLLFTIATVMSAEDWGLSILWCGVRVRGAGCGVRVSGFELRDLDGARLSTQGTRR
jgi:hypothetical protein